MTTNFFLSILPISTLLFSGLLTIDSTAQTTENCEPLYSPVCGQSGQEFFNECYLTESGDTKNKEGRCQADNCAEIEEPVCGSDGITYKNECYLEVENEWVNGENGLCSTLNTDDNSCYYRDHLVVKASDGACLEEEPKISFLNIEAPNENGKIKAGDIVTLIADGYDSNFESVDFYAYNIMEGEEILLGTATEVNENGYYQIEWEVDDTYTTLPIRAEGTTAEGEVVSSAIKSMVAGKDAVISMVSPVEGQEFTTEEPINISTEYEFAASGHGQFLCKVEFYNDDILLGSNEAGEEEIASSLTQEEINSSNILKYSWQEVQEGSHSLTAKAYSSRYPDSCEDTDPALSEPVNIVVTAPEPVEKEPVIEETPPPEKPIEKDTVRSGGLASIMPLLITIVSLPLLVAWGMKKSKEKKQEISSK